MKRFGAQLVGFIIFLDAFGLAHAVPAVSKIEWVDGTIIRITGNSFGIKVPAAPQYWADFEDSDKPTALSDKLAWDYLIGDRVSIVRGKKKSWAIRSDFSVGPEDARGPYIKNFNYDKWFVHFKRYYDFNITEVQGPVGFNLKMNRLWAVQFGGTPPYGNNIYVNYQGSEGLASGRAFNEYTPAQGATYFPTHLFQPRTWQTEQFIYMTSDIGVQNGIFHYVRDGVDIWSKSRRWQMRDATRPNKYNIFVFDQVANGTAAGPVYVYYDNIYVDNTWARVMLCDSATWTSCVKQEVQIPVTWVDNQIEAKLNFGDLDLNNPVYLYVVDGNGDVNSSGLLLDGIVSAPTEVKVIPSPK